MEPVPKLPNVSPDFDVLTFERQQREILHELQRKRSALDECRQELNDAKLKQQELERLLLIEKRRKDNENLQNKLMSSAAQVLEEEKQESKKTLNKLQVQLEIVTSERDTLREQVRAIQMENIRFKRMIEDYEGKQKCHSLYQADISEQQNRLKTSILHLTNMMQTLKKEQEVVRKLEQSSNLYAEMQLLVKQLKSEKEEAMKERDELEKECISKTAELSALKNLLENTPLLTFDDKQESITDYWMNRVKELEETVAKEKESVVNLSEALSLSKTTQKKLEEQQQKTIKENEEVVANLNKLSIKLETVDASCQTEELKIDDGEQKN